MNPCLEGNTRKIRAAVLRKKGGPLKIESLEMEGPRNDEVLVRLVASGICHTDIDFCDDWERSDNPLVLGHEGAGVVERVGKNVTGVKAGDHVVLSYQSCGHCRQCRSGHPAHCEHFYEANFGFERLDGGNAWHRSGVRGHFFGQSSFATHSLVTERNFVKISKDLPLQILSPMGCGLQTGAGTVMNSLEVPAGSSIAVFGTGAVGLAAVMAARLVGADSPKMHRVAIDVLNPNGVVALLTGESSTDLLPKGRRALGIIQGDAVPQRFIPKLIKLYQAGQFPFDRLLKFYDFSDINRAIADAKQGDTIKPVLRISRL